MNAGRKYMVSQKRTFALRLTALSGAALLLITVMSTGAMSWNTSGKEGKPISYKEALEGSCYIEGSKTPVSLKQLSKNADDQVPAISVQLGQFASCLAMSPDGNYLVSGDGTGKLKLWEIESGREVWTVQAGTGTNGIVDVSFSSDGRYIYSLARGNEGILIWDPLNGKRAGKIPIQVDIQVHDICDSYFTDNGSHVILSYDRRKPKTGLFELPSGRKIKVFTGSAKNLSPGGRYVLTQGYEHNKRTHENLQVLYLWNACSGKLIKSWTQKKTPLKNLGSSAFSPDGRLLAMEFFDVKENRSIHVLAMYKPKNGKQLWEGERREQALCVGLIFNGSSRVLYFSGKYPSKGKSSVFHLYALNPANGKILKQLDIGGPGRKGLALSHDGGQLLASVYGKKGMTIAFVDNEIFRLKKALIGFARGYHVALNSQGHLVTPYHVWDPATGQPVRRTGLPMGKNYLNLAVSPDGGTLILLESDNNLKTLEVIKYNLSSGTEMKKIPVSLKKGEEVWYSNLSPEGKSLLLEIPLKSIRILDADSGRNLIQINAPPGNFGAIWAKSFSPDGQYFGALMGFGTLQAGGLKSKIVVWKLSTGEKVLERELTEYGQISLPAISFCPNGRWMLISGRRMLKKNYTNLITTFKMNTQTGDILWKSDIPYDHKRQFRNIAVSRNQKLAAAQHYDGSVSLVDTDTGKIQKKLSGSADQVGTFVAFSPDNSRIYSNFGGGVLIRGVQSGRELARLFELKGGEWLSMTPEGYYASSEKADQYLNVRVGIKVNGLGQYYEIFYRPDLVADNLKFDATTPPDIREPKKNIRKVAAIGTPPRVSFRSTPEKTTISKRDVEIVVDLIDTGGGIGKVEWKINGVTVGIMEDADRGISVSRTGRKEVVGVPVKKRLTLSPGENVIQVTASNNSNEITSVPAVLNLTCRDEISQNPSLYLLTVGINKYRDGSLRLNYSVPDAQSISKIFDLRSKAIFEKVIIEQVLDENASMEGIQAAFEKIGRQAQTHDVFVFYVAGHGVAQEGRYYLLPYDFRFRNEKSIRQKGITQEHIQKWLASIRARKSLVLMDTCNSGAFTQAKAAQRGIAEKTAVNRLTRATGRAIIVAAKDDQPAIEGYKGHGVFTYVLLSAFKEADQKFGNRDGQTSIFELAAYVDEHVPEITYKQFGYEQVPQVNMQGRDFPIATAP